MQGRDGGAKGYGYVMEQMRRGKYEGANDSQFVLDMQARFALQCCSVCCSVCRRAVERLWFSACAMC